MPAILVLLVAGILAGPLLGLLDPQKLFGPLLIPLVSLSVAMILFEGSLTLRFARDPAGWMYVASTTQPPKPTVGWLLIALIENSPDDERTQCDRQSEESRTT